MYLRTWSDSFIPLLTEHPLHEGPWRAGRRSPYPLGLPAQQETDPQTDDYEGDAQGRGWAGDQAAVGAQRKEHRSQGCLTGNPPPLGPLVPVTSGHPARGVFV